MVWVDRLVEEIEKRFAKEIAAQKTHPGTGALLIRDEKTLSGRVHVGSLRGIVLHGLVAQVLQEKNIACEFKFELNDADPMDGLPTQVERETYLPHMGKPLFAVPAPKEGPWAKLALSAPNYPMVFGEELKGVVAPLKLPISFYTLRPLYEAGKFNDCITDALNHAERIRTIYAQVSGGKKPEDWNPLQVICETCGKMGTTQVVAWDSGKKEVTYECRKDLVTWAVGCGHRGTVNPYDGRAKLPWKVEWAAKWKVLGVKIEGAGKDHSAAGGSRAIAARISEEVFRYPNPFDIPYEFFLISGKKMSASKGLGASAKEVADLLPPILTKLLMIRKQPNQPIDFDPSGTTIPLLFDEYDRLSDHYFRRHPNPDADFSRTFALTQLDFPKPPEDLWHMRFTTLSFVLQMPHLTLEEEAEKLKKSGDGGRGAPLGRPEKENLQERAHYVQQWLAEHAPTEFKYEILAKFPENLALDAEQKNALSAVLKTLSNPSLPWEGPKIHEAIHGVKAELGIAPKKLFEPLYQLFLGRSSGPQIGWFLSTFEREQVVERLRGMCI